jgi:Trk K+ transport system NAD-binding subunit
MKPKLTTNHELSRVSFIVMRAMRTPLITLLVVYSVAILVMSFIPGVKIAGEVQYLSLFHSFYFMTYTATTTGFGEIPIEFSDAQRLWTIVCLYTSVVTWFYALGSIVRLFQNPFFLQAVEERRFSRSVRRIIDPFYIVCGFGDTGSVLVRGLNDAGLNVVVIDNNEERIQALSMRNYKSTVPGLCADASVPSYLIEAGLLSELCKGVVSITSNEEINLKISAVVRLLNPSIGIITMSKEKNFEETLATLGGDMHIVDAFKTFAKVLNACINNPEFYALNNWLIGDKNGSLIDYVHPPVGRWIICGYGRMGMEANHVLTKNGVKTSVIDPHSRKRDEEIETYIVGATNEKTLKKAGIDEAVGILAAANDDGCNLSVLLNARTLNPNLFTIVRQNSHKNELAFKMAEANMLMQPSLVTARKILLLLIAPLLKHFFTYLLARETGRDKVVTEVIARLRKKIADQMPLLVTVNFTAESSCAVIQSLKAGHEILLKNIIADPRDREKELDLVPFVIKSSDKKTILPTANYSIKQGDQLLFCGTTKAKHLLKSNINSEYTLSYLRTGKYPAMGYFMAWYNKRFNQKESA